MIVFMQNPRTLFKKIILGIFVIVFMTIVIFIGKKIPNPANPDDALSSNELKTLPHVSLPAGNLQLLVEPNDTMQPVISLIANAKKSVDVTMYEFDDKNISDALIAAEKRGVIVRVLLNKGYDGQVDPTQLATKNYLQAGGVAVEFTPSYFALTHQKTISVDDRASLIMTFNWTAKYYGTSRDFGILDNDQNDVDAIEKTFDADWNNKTISSQNGDDLIWSPGAETAMILTINRATKSLDVYNEEMNDPLITNALVSAEKRGVNVRVVMTYATAYKSAFNQLVQGNVNLRTYASSSKQMYIHAKMILADGNYAFVGSQNFSFSSLEKNRELGIFITDASILSQLEKIFEEDYNGARVYDVLKN
jgi:phosphatidylserine/phosphatidylglycerophosphate/cardiolipin synthase-like enzyme